MKYLLTLLPIVFLWQLSTAQEASITLDEYDTRMLTSEEKQTLRVASEIRKKRAERQGQVQDPSLEAISPPSFPTGAVIQPIELSAGESVSVYAKNLPVVPIAKLYSSLLEKEILISGTTSEIRLSIEMGSKSRSEAIEEIENELRTSGVEIIKLEEGSIVLIAKK